jgi:hypothetical protein
MARTRGNWDSTGRDKRTNDEIAAILSDLPGEHLARRAFARGRTMADIALHLRERRDLRNRLLNASWDQHRRATRRGGTDHPPAV